MVTQKLDQIPLLKEVVSGTSQEQQCGIYAAQINPSRTLLATGARNSSDIAIYRLPTMDPVCVGDVSVLPNIKMLFVEFIFLNFIMYFSLIKTGYLMFVGWMINF